MDWLYRFTSNDEYPDPVEEIDALCTLDDDGKLVFLMLADRSSPPLSGALCGDVVGLCTSENDRMILHGTGVIGGICHRGNTPPSVQPLYGKRTERVFCPLVDLVSLPSKPLDETVLSRQGQEVFLKGQPYVKRLAQGRRTSRQAANRRSERPIRSVVTSTRSTFEFPRVVLSPKSPGFTVIGLDPTAGTWDSKMTAGPKEMPSFTLKWSGTGFHPDIGPVKWHPDNTSFWTFVEGSKAKLTCIDGPCDTSGPRLSDDHKRWEPTVAERIREGEQALSRAGVNLFWTTKNTVMKFDGASRWIARSLVLFSEQPGQQKIETHPHGAFTFLWRMFGNWGTPPEKRKNPGRQARLAILRSFIPDLTESMVPNHDAVDAACAALVAGLHCLELTTPFGTVSESGAIWMPDTEKLREMLAPIEEASPRG